jgi:hypothetical protein
MELGRRRRDRETLQPVNDVIESRRAFCKRHGGRIAECARRRGLIIRVDEGQEEWRQHETGMESAVLKPWSVSQRVLMRAQRCTEEDAFRF